MEHLTQILLQHLRRRAAQVRERVRSDDGYSTETVIITALLAALGIAAVTIITAKVLAKARGINVG